MARFTLCFILLATAFGHAIQPAPLDEPVSTSNLTVVNPQMAAGGQVPLAVAQSSNNGVFASADEGICYKIRAYIFKRDDDHAPEFVGSTTCGPRQPRAKNAASPKARVVPAD